VELANFLNYDSTPTSLISCARLQYCNLTLSRAVGHLS